MNACLRALALVAVAAWLPACDSPDVTPRPPDFGLLSPSNGAIGVTGTPAFSWEESFGTTGYTVQVSKDSAFATTVVNQSGVSGTSLSPGVTLDPGETYFWRVIAERPDGDVSATGSPWSFTTVSSTPGSFTLTAPANSATGVSVAPTFSWTSSPGAASYRLQVATDAGLNSVVADQSGILTTSQASPVTLQPATVYFWQVIAESTNNVIATGAPFTFTTGSSLPGTFSMTSPSNGSTLVSTLPQFTWNPSTGATSYRLEVARDSNFNVTVIDQSGITTTSFTTTTMLLPTTTYFWRVTATNTAGTTPAAPTPFSFVTM